MAQRQFLASSPQDQAAQATKDEKITFESIGTELILHVQDSDCSGIPKPRFFRMQSVVQWVESM